MLSDDEGDNSPPFSKSLPSSPNASALKAGVASMDSHRKVDMSYQFGTTSNRFFSARSIVSWQ
jgi:hypothetical protein